MTKYIDKTKYKNKNRIIEGFAILDRDGEVVFTELGFTEKDMIRRHGKSIPRGYKIVKTRLEIMEELSPV